MGKSEGAWGVGGVQEPTIFEGTIGRSYGATFGKGARPILVYNLTKYQSFRLVYFLGTIGFYVSCSL